MFSQYINRKCVLVVAFATSLHKGGASSANYYGTLVAEDEEFIVVNVSHVKCEGMVGSFRKNSGNTYINKNYIVTINFE